MASVSYPVARAKRGTPTIYRRFSDVKPTDNGLVTFKLGSNPPFQAWADPTYGGGWVLVAQFVHAGGTNPTLTEIAPHANLPVLSPGALGDSESGIATRWGTISLAFLQAFPDATADLELRFYGVTSHHARVIHFVTDAMIDRWRNNVGTMLDVNARYILLPDHTAFLPRMANNTQNPQNIWSFPFYRNSTYHWGIRGGGSRWEVDNFVNNSAYHTIHRVWMRYKPGSTYPLITNGDLNQGAAGWTLVGNVTIVNGVINYSASDTAVTGIASQVAQTEAGSQYNLRYTVSRGGTCALTVARVTVEVRDSATNSLIASQVNQIAGATYNLSFTARGPVLIRFIDTTTNTANCDMRIDNVSLSRYQNG